MINQSTTTAPHSRRPPTCTTHTRPILFPCELTIELTTSPPGNSGSSRDVPSSLNFGGTRSAFFLNYHSGSDFFHQYDGTIAYGLQMVGGAIDRNFLYLQNSLSLESDLYLYETTEIDMSQSLTVPSRLLLIFQTHIFPRIIIRRAGCSQTSVMTLRGTFTCFSR